MAQQSSDSTAQTSFAHDLADASRQVREFLAPAGQSGAGFQVPHPAELMSQGIGNIPDTRREIRQFGLSVKKDTSLWLGASLPVHQALFLDKYVVQPYFTSPRTHVLLPF